MQKLIIAFVHAADAGPVADALREFGARFTRIPSLGGFLGEENMTFVMAVEESDVDGVVAVFSRASRERDLEVPLVLLERLAEWRARTVRHGGATILVADLDRLIHT
jgi:uncharacterized protein YaaQ